MFRAHIIIVKKRGWAADSNDKYPRVKMGSEASSSTSTLAGPSERSYSSKLRKRGRPKGTTNTRSKRVVTKAMCSSGKFLVWITKSDHDQSLLQTGVTEEMFSRLYLMTCQSVKWEPFS